MDGSLGRAMLESSTRQLAEEVIRIAKQNQYNQFTGQQASQSVGIGQTANNLSYFPIAKNLIKSHIEALEYRIKLFKTIQEMLPTQLTQEQDTAISKLLDLKS